MSARSYRIADWCAGYHQLLLSAATSELLRTRSATQNHLACLCTGLKTIPRERRRSRSMNERLLATLAAFEASAASRMKEHDRLVLERERLMRKTVGRRSTSHLVDLIEFVLSRPIVNAQMIATHLGITPRAVPPLVAELGIQERTGRMRYRAWSI